MAQAAGLETAFVAYVYGVQVVEMRWHQGRLGEMVDLVRAAAASTPRAFVRCGLAATLARTGLSEEVQPVLDGLALEGWPDLVEDEFYLSCLVVLAEAASALADERGPACWSH